MSRQTGFHRLNKIISGLRNCAERFLVSLTIRRTWVKGAIIVVLALFLAMSVATPTHAFVLLPIVWAVGIFAVAAFGIMTAVLIGDLDWEKLLHSLSGAALDTFRNITLVVLGFLASILQSLLSFLSLLTGTVIDMQQQLLMNDVVHRTWLQMINIANAVFVIALLTFVVMIILRQTGYNFKKAVISLIIAIGLANVSELIVKALNALANLLASWGAGIANAVQTNMFGAPIASTATFHNTVLGSLFSLFDVLYTNNQLDAAVEAAANASTKVPMTLFSNLTEVVCLVAFMGLGVYVVYRLFFLFAERLVRVVLYLIFAPLAFAAGLLPNKELTGVPSKWWVEILKWMLVYPAATLLMGFGFVFMTQAGSPKGLVGTIFDLVRGAATSGGATPTVAILQPIVFAIIAIVLFLMAANIAKVTGITAVAAVGAAAAWLPGMLKQAGQKTWATTRKLAAAPVTAAAKYAGARAAGVAKNVGFRLATTGPLKPVAAWAYKIARKPLLAEEAQAKERELYFKGLDAQQQRVRYVNLNKQVTSARDAAARAQTGGKKKKYDDLDEAEKKKVDAALSRNPVVSGRIRNLQALEGGYMRTLGGAAKDEYDLGKMPTQTYDEAIKAFEKYKASKGTDAEAGFRMQVLFDVLKKQSLHLTGKQRDVAIGYRDELAGNESYRKALEDTGFPRKFGYHTFGAGGEIDAEAFAKLAVDASKVKEAQNEVARLKAALVGLGHHNLGLDIRGSAPQTLRAISDVTVGTTLLDRGVKNRITQTTQKLKPGDAGEIVRIQQSSDLGETEKATLIERVLTRVGVGTPGRSGIAQVLAKGVAVEDLGRAQTISEVLHAPTTPAGTKTTTEQHIVAVEALRQAEVQRAATQSAIASATGSHPGYEVALRRSQRQATLPPITGVSPQDYVKMIPTLKTEVLETLGMGRDAPAVQAIMEKKTEEATEIAPLRDRILDAAKYFGLTQIERGKGATIGQHLEMLNNLEQTAYNLGRRPRGTEGEE